MRTFLRTFLIALAGLGVSVLGYYAYTIATSTLSFPFVGQETQQGSALRFAVARPTWLMQSGTGDVLDRDALLASLSRDGVSWDPTVSGEGRLVVSGEFVEIANYRSEQDTRIHIDADTYNARRSTPYQLPHSLDLVDTKIPHNLSIQPTGLLRDRIFSLEMYGYTGLSTPDIRWYIHTDVSRGCTMSDDWDSAVWRPVSVTEIVSDQAGQIERAQYRLSYDSTLPRVCIIAGVGGDFTTVVDTRISPFVTTPAVTSMLSPEYDLQSEIEFRFSHDIFADTGALYSDAYIEHRRLQKISILQSLDISPAVPLTEEQIMLSPDRVTILGAFQEGTEYTIRLRDVMDEYGRESDTKFVFTPVSEPFLSLGLTGRRTMFRAGEDIGAKMYAMKTPKDSYTMKLCRISMEGYARAERMIAEGKREDIESIYSMIDGGTDTSACTKKDIVIASGAVVAPFSIQDMYADRTIAPGLYIIAPREKLDALAFNRMVLPRVFSVVDSQITMKVDASGKMSFLVTDINTGAPRAGQEIELRKNILRTYTESWDSVSQQSIKTYLPFTNRSFATGVVLGTTLGDGSFQIQRDALIPGEYSPPYGLMYEWYDDYEGQYQSFVATTLGDGHFGYVVSTWNDGITGWNFGFKDSDYSWETRGAYMSYLHTDRKLYLPGEKVYLHAILRADAASLTIPVGTQFTLKVTDPMGTEVQSMVLEPNEFGTISTELDLDKNASLGSYMVQLSLTADDTETVENGYTNFQVEVFKNPTFTASVKLTSPDIENDILLTLRKKDNTDRSYPWYKDVYSSTFSIDGIVKANSYNGAQMKGIPFSYRIYRSPYYDSSYWSDCFWGCYYEPSPEFYTEGTGVIDHDGVGILHVPVEFSSFYDDYVYTAEVTIRDPSTGESVVTPSTLLARLPQEYKAFDPYNPLIFTPVAKILSPGDTLSGSLSFTYGKWDVSLKNKYRYELIHREYSRTLIDDLRVRDTAITDSHDVSVLSGAITGTGLSLSTKGLSPGEYHLRVSPITDGTDTPPETSISDTLIYITGNFVDANASLRVIPEKTIYHAGETARVMITTPFTGGYLYITRERGGVLDHEYVEVTGNTLLREYIIDDTFYPNVYIGVVAFAPQYTSGNRNYAVGYGEIITDLADKKASLTITPDKTTYKNRETVNLSLHLTDRANTPLVGEVAVMVVDESLIRLLGNIDLDVVAKFFRKAPFTMKTALSAIGMEKNRFLSRKGSNGGSGDKGGGGIALASRILFRNTAYYNPSVRTDAKGDAKVSFTLPDNITDYRIITIGQTKDSRFAVAQETIQVRKDYTIETHVPYIAYPGDAFQAIATIYNATKKITSATVVTTFGSGADTLTLEKSVVIQAFSSTAVDVTIPVGKNWKGDTPYTITVREKETPLDSITRTIRIADIPLIEAVSRQAGVLTGTQTSLDLISLTRDIDPKKSHIVMRTARGLLRDPASTLAGLIEYPYGCIEQTIASTLPNAIALRFASLLDITIDTPSAQQNLDDGVAKILRMQTWGGWKYWEDDASAHPQVTPYVIRSLYVLRDMGVTIPQSSIDAGLQYIVDMVDYQGTSLDGDAFAEIFATLARARHPRALSLVPRLEELRKGRALPSTDTTPVYATKFSRHGLLMYVRGLQYLGQVPEDLFGELRTAMDKDVSTTYWYWDTSADQAIYAGLLLDRGDLRGATTLLDRLTRETNLSSYYVSTQTKIQLLLALTRHRELTNKKGDIPMTLRSDGLIANLDLIGKAYSRSIDIARDTASDMLSLTRGTGAAPTFYELLQYDVASDIFQMQPTSARGMTVSRVFESVDESRGIDTDGAWIMTTPMTDSIFQKGQLYRVILTVTPPPTSGVSYYLTLEDFVPGGWRPIRGILQTESMMTTDDDPDGSYWNGWSHVEARDDRILATADSLWSSDPQTYTYYIRPEYVGTYLLPPVTAYYMYRPEVHAIGRYERVEVRE